MPTPSGLPTKTDFQNAQLDVAHLGRVVNSKDAQGNPITTSTNRTGGVNKTLYALEAEYTEAIRNAGGQPIGDGTWQAGQTFTAYNQFMVYNGIAYKPLTTTVLPYGPTGATPDLAFVGPFSENEYRGEWTPTTDVVKWSIYGYQGSEWRSLTGVSGVAPTDGNDWRGFNDYGTLPNGKSVKQTRASDLEISSTVLADGRIVKNNGDGSMHIGDGETVGGIKHINTVNIDRFSGAMVSRLKQKLDFNQENIYVLCQGDSTGDADYEFFRRMADKMAPKYPKYTFRYIKWNHAGTNWDAPVNISVGTGTNVIDFYNGSHAGATHGYWTGNRNQYAYDNKVMDVIISNYGLNVGTSWRNQAEQLAEYLFTLRQQQPKSEVLVTVQSPDYNILDRSALRADAQRYVAGLYGCQVIDVYNLFIELVKSTNGDTSPWYVDDIHPTPEGADRWADVAIRNIEYDYAGGACSRKRIDSGPSLLPNGNFLSWLNGTNDVPTFWSQGAGQTAVKNTVQFETNGASVRSSGFGAGTGVLYVDGIDEIFEKYKHWGDIVVAARVYSQGGSVLSGKCGKVFAAHSVSTSYTEIQNTQGLPGYVDNGWRWAFLLIEREFIEGNSDFRIGVFTGKAGEFCSVDRIIIAPTLLPNECDGSSKWQFRKEINDSSFTVNANSGRNRIFEVFSGIVQPGCKVTAIPRDVPAGLQIDAYSTAAGNVVVRISNFTASNIVMPSTTYTVLISTDE